MKKMIIFTLIWVFGCSVFSEVEIRFSNAQCPGTKQIEISYDVSSDVTNAVTVSLVVNNGATPVNATNVTGDVGTGISTGNGKQIVWNMETDWDGNFSKEMRFSVTADDGTGLVSSFSCPPVITGQTTSFADGDDGDLPRGVLPPNPRFTDNGNGTVSDRLTGLQWVKDPLDEFGQYNTKTWASAVEKCYTLTDEEGDPFAGYDDWRLPTILELSTLFDYDFHSPAKPSGCPLIMPVNATFWSSTLYAITTNDAAWGFVTKDGLLNFNGLSYNQFYWPVREEDVANAKAPVQKTGAKYSFQDGDDGDIQPGVAWPASRFTDNSDGTVLDNLTGLEWIKDPHALPGNANSLNWSNSINLCEELTYADHSDWRLPNVVELRGIVDFSRHEPALTENHPFVNIKSGNYDYYWTSTTSPRLTEQAYFLRFKGGGYSSISAKNNGGYFSAWPMRETKQSIAQADSRDYALTMASGHGATVPAIGTHSEYCWESTVTCSVESVTADGWMFNGWTNAVVTDYTKTNTVVLMDTLSKTLTALFSDDPDGDGLKNTNEWAIGTDPRNSDTDGDSMSDPDEVTAGTSPTNSSSFFEMEIHSQETDGVLSWFAVSNRYYRVEYKTSLTGVDFRGDPLPWQSLGDVISGSNAVYNLPDPSADTTRFYRLFVTDDPANFD